MGRFIDAKKVGDKYRDACGMVSTIVHLDDTRKVVRRAGRGFPTFSVFSADGSRVIASGLRTLSSALSA